jgi:hypothetical protein
MTLKFRGINLACFADLFLFVGINGIEVFSNQVLPEFLLGTGEEVHFSLLEVGIFHPVRVDEIVSFLVRFCTQQTPKHSNVYDKSS